MPHEPHATVFRFVGTMETESLLQRADLSQDRMIDIMNDHSDVMANNMETEIKRLFIPYEKVSVDVDVWFEGGSLTATILVGILLWSGRTAGEAIAPIIKLKLQTVLNNVLRNVAPLPISAHMELETIEETFQPVIASSPAVGQSTPEPPPIAVAPAPAAAVAEAPWSSNQYIFALLLIDTLLLAAIFVVAVMLAVND